ncbi:MAG: hypothetical protein AAB296_04450 [Candidatus Desantisbacteria bacterium]
MKAHERATQVWAVLALAARNRQILTYDILSRLIGVPTHGLSNILDHVQQYCVQKDIPPLTIIVVNKETGLPGSGFTAAEDIPRNQGNVFNYDWLVAGAPSPDDLKAVKGSKTKEVG